MPEDGSYVVVSGLASGVKPRLRVRAFELPNLKPLLSLEERVDHRFSLDPSGKILALGEGDAMAVFEMPTGRSTGRRIDAIGELVAPDAATWRVEDTTGRGRLLLARKGDSEPFLVLSLDQRLHGGEWWFSRDGRKLAWGYADGSVVVADLTTIRRELASVGLGWE
jgi:hypothetical protein